MSSQATMNGEAASQAGVKLQEDPVAPCVQFDGDQGCVSVCFKPLDALHLRRCPESAFQVCSMSHVLSHDQ